MDASTDGPSSSPDLIAPDAAWPSMHWVKVLAGSGRYARFTGVGVDSKDNILVAGMLRGDAAFDTSKVSATEDTVFVAKLSPTGRFVWVRTLARTSGGIYSTTPPLVMGPNNTVLVVGQVRGSIDPKTFKVTPSNKAAHALVARWSADGAPLGVVMAGGTGNSVGIHLALDSKGNGVFTGHFSGTATLGPTTFKAVGSNDIFVSRFDTSGRITWAARAGDANSPPSVHRVAINAAGTTFITGKFHRSITLGAHSLSSKFTIPLFVASLDTLGNFNWAEVGGGWGHIYPSDLIPDSKGGLELLATFNQDVTFGSHTIKGKAGLAHIKLNATGQFTSAQNLLLTPATGSPVRLIRRASGKTYLGGTFQGPTKFNDTLIFRALQL